MTQRVDIAILIAVAARTDVSGVTCRSAGRRGHCRGVAMRMGCLIIRVFRIAAGAYSADIVVTQRVDIGIFIAVST